MKPNSLPRLLDGILTEASPDWCPYCGEPVELVSLIGIATIRTDPESILTDRAGTPHAVRLIHICDDVNARFRVLRDLVRACPREAAGGAGGVARG